MQRIARLLCLPWLFTVLILATLPTVPSPARAQEVEVSVFYDALAPHGRWFQHAQWGYVWTPRVGYAGWRPYSRGHWVWTEEYGWYWVSDEEWGWGPYHYGRWVLDDEYGWIWVPGTEWGPAWVAWRWSDDYAGWAPLPPDRYWDGGGLRFSLAVYEEPRYAPVWCFVRPGYITSPVLYRYVVPPARNVTIVHTTVNVTNYTVINQRVVNRGIDVRHIERISGKPIQPIRVVAVSNPRQARFAGGGKQPGVIQTFRPASFATPASATHTVPPAHFANGRWVPNPSAPRTLVNPAVTAPKVLTEPRRIAPTHVAPLYGQGPKSHEPSQAGPSASEYGRPARQSVRPGHEPPPGWSKDGGQQPPGPVRREIRQQPGPGGDARRFDRREGAPQVRPQGPVHPQQNPNKGKPGDQKPGQEGGGGPPPR